MAGFDEKPYHYFQPGSAGIATTDIELSISGRNLRDMDFFSKSDPMCVVYTKPFDQPAKGNWKEIARTECLENDLNPNFAAKVRLRYVFEQQQLLRFEVYDIDSESDDLQDHDFIGAAECTLGQIVSAANRGSGGSKLKLNRDITNHSFKEGEDEEGLV